jgi:transketolase
MRAAFVQALVELADADERILLLTGDLGYMALEPFATRYPARFFNAGVAEQNMVGVATGLAEAGYIPYVYSIVNFAVLRPYEFIRNGPIFHHLPVRIVGMGGGLEYGHNGASHHGLEDVGVMRLQPGLTVIAPADHCQARAALLASWDVPGPVYYRLGKDDRTIVPGLDGRFELGRAQLIGDGPDVLIVTMGSIASEVLRAVDLLAGGGVHATVLVVASVNPPPVADLRDALARFSLALTVEAHYTVGGVGSLVAEVIADQGLHCRIVRAGVRTNPDGRCGSQDCLYRLHGLSADRLAESVLEALRQPAADGRN